MSLASDRTTDATIGLRRLFTSLGVDPYDEVVWERRDARITNWLDGSVAFEQLDVEFPVSWSQNATNIVAQKYFRGTLGTAQRESSLRQVVDRIVDTIADWGIADGYVAGDEAAAFRDELKYILVTQRAAFNSPVWFNIGVAGVPQQASACFILAVDDEMPSILNWYREEGIIFKGGSGAGVNLSRIRSSFEPLEGGGTASGPVSFMRGADASAGTIKSGGKTRRAAKMVILDADHPDIRQFVWTKAIEERKARALSEAGFDMGLDGVDAFSVQYQNANNSVRVTDEFMQAVVADGDWELRAVTTGEVLETVTARDLWREIAEAAWECADPGLQFDTTINRWHTAPNHGRITASNPCFTADSRVHTDKGLVRFDELFARVSCGEEFQVWTHDLTNPEAPTSEMHLTTPDAFMITGKHPVQRLRFSNGAELRCTPGHAIFTLNRGWVEAQELTPEDRVRSLDLPAAATAADWAIPVSADLDDHRVKGDRDLPLVLPEVWTDGFAHYLGWLIGDGSTSGASTVTIYGSADDRTEILPHHVALLEGINGERPIKLSDQANGTVQLRLTRRPLKAYLEALGVRSVTGEHKTVPWSIEQAPPEVVAAFLRGLFDADGCAVLNAAKGFYVGLGSISVELLRGVQRLLTTFGITSRIYNVKRAGASTFTYERKDGSSTTYHNRASFDLRITGASMHRFAAEIGFSLSRKAEVLRGAVVGHETYDVDTSIRLVDRIDEGVELTYNLSEPRNHSYVVNGVVVRNCSEYFHVDNSACNLASINLLKYLDDDGSFDVDGFVHTVRTVFTAMEVLVGRADYPTEQIGATTRALRQLGLGYANLGALLMALGLPYDSPQGRAWAAAMTSLMAGSGYETSARLAARMGPFDGFDVEREAMLGVLGMHREAASSIEASDAVPAELVEAGIAVWDTVLQEAAVHGVRNSQAVVIAPTGTIGLAMDCDTTGIEPDLALVKTKKLVGGGTMSIVNQTIPRALRRLGYSPDQVDDIVAYIDEHMSVIGAPHLAPGHLPVFACSMGDNSIHYEGHVRMMGAVQPFVSGGISKTVNMPEDVTVEDIEGLHMLAWELGLKSVAIYRDNCKLGQPLSTSKAKTPASAAPSAAPTQVVERIVHHPVRQKMPRTRRGRTFEFRVADCKGFATIGEYDNGQPGEIFLTVSKQGSTMAGVMDAFAKSVSYGLQYGVPLRAFVEAFTNMRFEPAGMTDDPDIRFASSIMDYLFRRLAIEYMTYDERAELGIFSVDERLQPTLPGVEEQVTATSQGTDLAPDPKSPTLFEESIEVREVPVVPPVAMSDAPMCMTCGISMIRSGSCYVCTSCGSTSGCS
ncbi:MAG TPA: LAGLIDADG family homing endonuclease [Ilumatobacteraceae bacterium]|nr:LAGLIDADG family homing endonuclease [Ilumatobacteraceae bacterium]